MTSELSALASMISANARGVSGGGRGRGANNDDDDDDDGGEYNTYIKQEGSVR